MTSFLVVSGSPSAVSKTALLGDLVASRLGEARHVRLRDLPPAALLAADASDPQVRDAVDAVAAADAVVLLTPIYKAGAAGLLKVFLDLLPQNGFEGKTVLPMALCRSMAHLLALDYGLHPVLQSMGSQRVLRSLVLLEEHLEIDPSGRAGLVPDGELRLLDVVAELRDGIVLSSARV
ncbi:NAD(P)H-dependent oxidoreductase [Lentzea sp. NPDC051213]|uniref:NAD(P)H-dependent oxidoreductase n=1 Tax=Lentzea sp. NPDC051213 TaxID=3364126 RepID=UPI0037B94F49